jgi:hypothetical protein
VSAARYGRPKGRCGNKQVLVDGHELDSTPNEHIEGWICMEGWECVMMMRMMMMELIPSRMNNKSKGKQIPIYLKNYFVISLQWGLDCE